MIMGKKENSIEQPVCDYAEYQGFEVRKVRYIAREGCPDRLFMGYGSTFFIEFKHPDGELSKTQIREVNKMRAAGTRVFVVDDVEDGKIIVDGAKLNAERDGHKY